MHFLTTCREKNNEKICNVTFDTLLRYPQIYVFDLRLTKNHDLSVAQTKLKCAQITRDRKNTSTLYGYGHLSVWIIWKTYAKPVWGTNASTSSLPHHIKLENMKTKWRLYDVFLTNYIRYKERMHDRKTGGVYIPHRIVRFWCVEDTFEKIYFCILNMKHFGYQCCRIYKVAWGQPYLYKQKWVF